MITRGIVPHLDFDITIGGGKYTIANKEEDEKYIILEGFAINPTNDDINFVWPASVTVTRNNNYVFTIQGVNSLKQPFIPPIKMDCNENWTIVFDNYDANTNIHLFGNVLEPEGRNMNYY